MYLKILFRESPFYVNKGNWDQNTPSNSSRAPGTKLRFGKERVHREGSSKSVCFMSVVLARKNSGKDHLRRPSTKKDAPAMQQRIWRKICTSSRIRTKLRFMFLVKSEVCRHLSLQRDQKSENSWSIQEH